MNAIRDNMLKALRCERNQTMPFCFLVDNFNYPEGTPAELLNPLDIIGMQRRLGGALTERCGPLVVNRNYRQVRYSLASLENGLQLEEWQTDAGRISRRYKTTAGGTFFENRGIVDLQGYKTLIDIVQDYELILNDEAISQTDDRLADIGDDGILYSVGPSSPIMELMRSWIDLQQFIYDMYDHQELMEQLMSTMACRYYEEYELLAANTPAKVIVFWDCVDSLHVSPAHFKKYVVPVYRNYADICHKYGKTIVCHTCGRINAFLEMFLETGIDAIDWLTPPETGDVIFSHAQDIWQGCICMMGTLAPAEVRFQEPDLLESHLRHVLNGVDTKHGFIFQVPLPLGTPMNNVDRITQIVREIS